MTSQIDQIRYRLADCSVWRAHLAKHFAHDPRNTLANRALGKLALAPESQISKDTLAAIAPFAGTPRFDDALKLAAKDVGFRSRPETLDEFIGYVQEYLNSPPRTDVPQPGATLANVLPSAQVAQ